MHHWLKGDGRLCIGLVTIIVSITSIISNGTFHIRVFLNLISREYVTEANVIYGTDYPVLDRMDRKIFLLLIYATYWPDNTLCRIPNNMGKSICLCQLYSHNSDLYSCTNFYEFDNVNPCINIEEKYHKTDFITIVSFTYSLRRFI